MECTSDLDDVENPKIAFSSLHAPEVGSVKACAISQCLLRNPKEFARCANSGTEALEVGLAHCVHVLAREAYWSTADE